jgi:hypothetical protein
MSKQRSFIDDLDEAFKKGGRAAVIQVIKDRIAEQKAEAEAEEKKEETWHKKN